MSIKTIIALSFSAGCLLTSCILTIHHVKQYGDLEKRLDAVLKR